MHNVGFYCSGCGTLERWAELCYFCYDWACARVDRFARSGVLGVNVTLHVFNSDKLLATVGAGRQHLVTCVTIASMSFKGTDRVVFFRAFRTIEIFVSVIIRVVVCCVLVASEGRHRGVAAGAVVARMGFGGASTSAES